MATKRYLLCGHSPVHTRLYRFPKFLSIYRWNTEDQEKKIRQRHLQYLQLEQQHKQSSIRTMDAKTRECINKIRLLINSKLNSTGQITDYWKIKTKQIQSEYSINSEGLSKRAFNYLSLYYESLQNLIEGRREVLHDQDFQFEDGKSASQKTEAFEKMLSNFVGKTFSKQINDRDDRL